MCPFLAAMLAQLLCHMQMTEVNNHKAHYTKAHGNGVTGSYKTVIAQIRKACKRFRQWYQYAMKKRICIWPNESNSYRL